MDQACYLFANNTKKIKNCSFKAKANINLSQIDGVDVNRYLRRVLWKMPRYVSMLRSCVVHLEYSSAEIKKALVVHDFETAERLVHTPKGLVGNVGAIQLRKLVATLEKLIKEKSDAMVIESQLAAFRNALQTISEY